METQVTVTTYLPFRFPQMPSIRQVGLINCFRMHLPTWSRAILSRAIQSVPIWFHPRAWHPRIANWTIKVPQGPRGPIPLYTIVQLTESDIMKAMIQVQRDAFYLYDPWNGAVRTVTTIFRGIHFKLFGNEPNNEFGDAYLYPERGHFVAVLPFRPSSEGIVTVAEEIHICLDKMLSAIRENRITTTTKNQPTTYSTSSSARSHSCRCCFPCLPFSCHSEGDYSYSSSTWCPSCSSDDDNPSHSAASFDDESPTNSAPSSDEEISSHAADSFDVENPPYSAGSDKDNSFYTPASSFEEQDSSYSSGSFEEKNASHSSSLRQESGPRLVVFAMARFSGLSERKFRRIGVPDFLFKIRNAFELQNPRETSICTLLMTVIDLEQCGLISHVSIERFESGSSRPVMATIAWSDLRRYVFSISQVDSLLCDLLIASNDYVTRNHFGTNLRLDKLEIGPGQLGRDQAVDPDLMDKAIRDVHMLQAVRPERRTDVVGDGMNTASIVAEAVKYALGLALRGVDTDYPRKILGLGYSFHLLNRGDGVFIPFKRSVKSVSPVGYRIRKLSVCMWIAVVLGLLLLIGYITWRASTSELALEELINTAISIAGLYIGIASSLLFQTVYRGERLTDVLSNVRNIDSQEEFKRRKVLCQQTDILEVIRLAQQSPQFMGGRNMGYLRHTHPEGLLETREPILFPNLELAGFGLYEDEDGELFLLDRWMNLFEVVIGKKATEERGRSGTATYPPEPSEPENTGEQANGEEDEPSSVEITKSESIGPVVPLNENPSEQQICNPNPSPSNAMVRRPTVGDKKEYTREAAVSCDDIASMSIYCSPVQQTVLLKAEPGHSCLKVKYVTDHGREPVKSLTRILPFGARERKVVNREWRRASVESWLVLFNSDILEMQIGKGVRDDVVGF